MGTREVYEGKLRSGNLHHDPTMIPGLGSARCSCCLCLLNLNSDKDEWTITSVLHEATAVATVTGILLYGSEKLLNMTLSQFEQINIAFQAGFGIGGMLGAVHGFNTGIPFLQNRLNGPKWLPFVTVIPLLLMFSVASAAFGEFKWLVTCEFVGYALPKFAQLTVTSYYAASSASHYGISLLTRRIEEAHTSRTWQKG